jgi:HAD superfamily hydrolase (TIGR01549 family)
MAIVRDVQSLALFDLDNTLVDRDKAFRAWVEEFVVAEGLDDAARTFLLMADAHHSASMENFFATIAQTFGLSVQPDQLWRQYRRRMPELASCHPDDHDALARLRRAGWRIGIVTNGMRDNQLGKIRNTRLDRLVDAWCISSDVGIRKPDPEIFRLAAERCGSGRGQGGWMIGDSLIHDIAGGHAAGLRTIWLQPKRQPASRAFGGPAPDVIVDSVFEAVEVLLGSP